MERRLVPLVGLVYGFVPGIVSLYHPYLSKFLPGVLSLTVLMLPIVFFPFSYISMFFVTAAANHGFESLATYVLNSILWCLVALLFFRDGFDWHLFNRIVGAQFIVAGIIFLWQGGISPPNQYVIFCRHMWPIFMGIGIWIILNTKKRNASP